MRIIYRGNYAVDFTTESHVARTLEQLGHVVERVDERRVSWNRTIEACRGADLFLWTSTYELAHRWPQNEAHAAVETLCGMLPTAALHLDLFFGLERAWQVRSEPWFRLHHVFTADGDHDAEFVAAGVNHRWLRPGVLRDECYLAPADRNRGVVFVGSHQHYHPEWPFRKALAEHLVQAYDAQLVPGPGRPAVRGAALNALYASAAAVVGDSCFSTTLRNYTSDRIYETAGRGGLLVYPRIPCLEDELVDGEHVFYYAPGDLADLDRALARVLALSVAERQAVREAAVARVRERCTYHTRLEEMLDCVFTGAAA